MFSLQCKQRPPNATSRANAIAGCASRAITGAVSGALLGLLCLSSFGCHTIGRITESKHTVAARRLSRQGLQAMRNGRWDQAEQLFGNALTVSQDDDRAHRGIAEAYWNRGDYDQAILHMEKAVELSGQEPRLVARLGEMYFITGRLDDAQQQGEIALAGDRESPQIWVLRGDCFQQRGNSREAMAAYHRALAIQPDLVAVKLKIADLYLESKQYDRLLATLDQFDPAADDSQMPTAVHMMRGIALRSLQRPELAVKHFAKAAEHDPNAAEPLLQIASIELSRGDAYAAHLAIERAAQRDQPLVQQTGWVDYMLSPQQVIALDPNRTGASSPLR
ncbi:MAG: hypothetical protein CME01_13410 [Geminicoccus sp.]|nr:hypothetical protein [Geminicoccus sp.]